MKKNSKSHDRKRKKCYPVLDYYYFALEELGCGTTLLEPYAHIWDYPDKYLFSIFRTEDVNLVKQNKKYELFRGTDSTSKFVFRIMNNPQKLCEKRTLSYPTSYESLSPSIMRQSEGFHIELWKNLGGEKNGATKFIVPQNLGRQGKTDLGQLYADNPKLEGTQFQQTEDRDNYLNVDYEKHLELKINYFF